MRGTDRSIFGGSSLYADKTTVNTDRPAPIGDETHPLSVSSSTALATTQPIVWDTNHYYRDLGVPTNATRKQMREAYIANGGSGNVRMTYCLKQLLNPTIRAEYDRTRLGDLFMDDDVAAMFDKMAAADAAKARANGEDISAEDVLRRWGLIVPDEDDTPDESVLDDGAVDPELSEPAATVWPYRYYLWRTQMLDDGRLATWQEQVRAALNKRGVHEQFSVGYAGRTPLQFLVGKVGNQITVFLNCDAQPSVSAAEKVADRVVEALHIEREKRSA